MYGEFILMYFLVLDSGVTRKEDRYDMVFESKYHCELYAMGEANRLYMIDTYKGKNIRMVYPGCAPNPFMREPIGELGWIMKNNK